MSCVENGKGRNTYCNTKHNMLDLFRNQNTIYSMLDKRYQDGLKGNSEQVCLQAEAVPATVRADK